MYHRSVHTTDFSNMAFSKTSTNLTLNGSVLSADCKDKQGNPQHSSIDLNKYISNQDGVLCWTNGGNFAASAVELSLIGATLHAMCRKINGVFAVSSINLDERISNINGVLSYEAGNFEIATWYDTWNLQGLNNLVSKKVPLNLATRYNLAFGHLAVVQSGAGYSIVMEGQYAAQVKEQITMQAPGAVIYAGLNDSGINETVHDNATYNNRSTVNIVNWLRTNGYGGISIDAEGVGMKSVPQLVTQLSGSFKVAGLGIAVSVPWPGQGPETLYGSTAVQVFNTYVDALELQDYSSGPTSADAHVWVSAGVKASILMGGICTENSGVQTSPQDTQQWTKYALQNGLRGMFSWRLDNDHGLNGQEEDINPTFTGARLIHDTATAV